MIAQNIRDAIRRFADLPDADIQRAVSRFDAAQMALEIIRSGRPVVEAHRTVAAIFKVSPSSVARWERRFARAPGGYELFFLTDRRSA
jgi:hypothetical protein